MGAAVGRDGVLTPVLASVLAVIVAISGCGDDGDSSDVCEGGVDGLDALLSAAPDPGSDDFAEAVDQLEQVEPPGAIADEWQALVDALVEQRDLDSGDIAEVNRANESLRSLDEELGRIESHIEDSCGESVGPG